MLFVKDTGEEHHFAPQLNAEFYAVCWGYRDTEEGIWFDDIHWPPPGPFDPEQIGSDAWYRYLTTRYDNEMPVSVAYAIANDVTPRNGHNSRVGAVYLVKTNEHGEIISMRLMSEE